MQHGHTAHIPFKLLFIQVPFSYTCHLRGLSRYSIPSSDFLYLTIDKTCSLPSDTAMFMTKDYNLFVILRSVLQVVVVLKLLSLCHHSKHFFLEDSLLFLFVIKYLITTYFDKNKNLFCNNYIDIHQWDIPILTQQLKTRKNPAIPCITRSTKGQTDFAFSKMSTPIVIIIMQKNSRKEHESIQFHNISILCNL